MAAIGAIGIPKERETALLVEQKGPVVSSTYPSKSADSWSKTVLELPDITTEEASAWKKRGVFLLKAASAATAIFAPTGISIAAALLFLSVEAVDRLKNKETALLVEQKNPIVSDVDTDSRDLKAVAEPSNIKAEEVSVWKKRGIVALKIALSVAVIFAPFSFSIVAAALFLIACIYSSCKKVSLEDTSEVTNQKNLPWKDLSQKEKAIVVGKIALAAIIVLSLLLAATFSGAVALEAFDEILDPVLRGAFWIAACFNLDWASSVLRETKKFHMHKFVENNLDKTKDFMRSIWKTASIGIAEGYIALKEMPTILAMLAAL